MYCVRAAQLSETARLFHRIFSMLPARAWAHLWRWRWRRLIRLQREGNGVLKTCMPGWAQTQWAAQDEKQYAQMCGQRSEG